MENNSTTRLLTLLNVSATKYGRRKWSVSQGPTQKLNKRKSVVVVEEKAEDITMSVEETVAEAIEQAQGAQQFRPSICISFSAQKINQTHTKLILITHQIT